MKVYTQWGRKEASVNTYGQMVEFTKENGWIIESMGVVSISGKMAGSITGSG